MQKNYNFLIKHI